MTFTKSRITLLIWISGLAILAIVSIRLVFYYDLIGLDESVDFYENDDRKQAIESFRNNIRAFKDTAYFHRKMKGMFSLSTIDSTHVKGKVIGKKGSKSIEYTIFAEEKKGKLAENQEIKDVNIINQMLFIIKDLGYNSIIESEHDITYVSSVRGEGIVHIKPCSQKVWSIECEYKKIEGNWYYYYPNGILPHPKNKMENLMPF